MRRHEREAAWDIPTSNHLAIRIDMRGRQCNVGIPGTGWQRFDTWAEGVAHAENTLGRKLPPERAISRRESWVDGAEGHAARLPSEGTTYTASAWSGDLHVVQVRIASWEGAITAGQRMLGALRALQREDAT